MAVLPIGYADGRSRALSGKVSFRIHGKDAPVIGRICMDMCMVDVSGIEGVSVGDTATLFGYDETGALIPCERVSDALGTIPYEVLCFCEQAHPTFLHGKWPSFADFAVHRLTDGIEWNESIAGRYKSVRRVGNYR